MKKSPLLVKHKAGDYEVSHDLAHTLFIYIDAIVKYNQDLVVVFDGAEGAGKSTLMRQVAELCRQYLAQKHNIKVPFNLDNIHFDLDEYTKAALDNEDNKCWIHILDESRAVANRKRTTSKGNVNWTNYLSECRSANHIHLIALPAFHDLDSYISVFRQSFLVNIQKYFKITKTEKGVPIYELVLGEYRAFLNDNKLKAMYYHKMRYIYPRVPVFKAKFSNTSVLDEESYENKKKESRARRYSEEKKIEEKKDTKKDLVLNYMKREPKARAADIANIFNVSQSYVNKVKQTVTTP